MATKRHYIEGDAIGGGGVTVQAEPPPTSGDLWFNTSAFNYSLNPRGNLTTVPATGALYAKVNGIFRRSDTGACYPSQLYATRRDIFCGKRCVSRSRTKKSKFYKYIVNI